jgi:transcriptional regulator GlxA family with amidase domain
MISRVQRAGRELATTKTPIAAIAASGGFAGQNHFSRVFARITGMSPARYRKLYQ